MPLGDTVITPAALARSNFRQVKAKDLYTEAAGDVDEMYIFIFPSPDPADEVNGDGQLLEVYDISRDYDKAFTHRRTIDITPETVLYVR